MKLVIQIDEMKPHWAEQQGLHQEAERIGMTGVTIGGDFDAKIALIYGNVENLSSFEATFRLSRFSDIGTWCRVTPLEGDAS